MLILIVVVAMISKGFIFEKKKIISIGEIDLAIQDYSKALEIDNRNSKQS